MSDEREREPTIGDVLEASGELRTGVQQLRKAVHRQGFEISAINNKADEQGKRLDLVNSWLELIHKELHGNLSETRREFREVPAAVVVGVMAGIDQASCVRDLQVDADVLRAEISELKAEVAELKRAAG